MKQSLRALWTKNRRHAARSTRIYLLTFLVTYPFINTVYHLLPLSFERLSLNLVMCSLAVVLGLAASLVFRKKLIGVPAGCYACTCAFIHLLMLLLCYIIFSICFRTGASAVLYVLPDFSPIARYETIVIAVNIIFAALQSRRNGATA